MPKKIAYYDLTPDDIKAMSKDDLEKLINFIQRKSADFSIVNDLIRDRNEFRACYNKLVKQLQDLGIEPIVDYYRLGKTGRPTKTAGNNSKDAKKRRKVTKKDV